MRAIILNDVTISEIGSTNGNAEKFIQILDGKTLKREANRSLGSDERILKLSHDTVQCWTL
jgi:hypothetical protein